MTVKCTHNWDSGTALKAGKVKYTCSICGETKTGDCKHNYVETVVAPTKESLEPGYTTKKCSICGKEGEPTNITYYPEPTEEQAYNDIMALQAVYPTGTPWSSGHGYDEYEGPIVGSGSECAAWAFMCSDIAFGKSTAVYTHKDLNKLKIGDIINYQWGSNNWDNTHFAIVLAINDDGSITTCDGNHGGCVTWGSKVYFVNNDADINLSHVKLLSIETRYQSVKNQLIAQGIPYYEKYPVWHEYEIEFECSDGTTYSSHWKVSDTNHGLYNWTD